MQAEHISELAKVLRKTADRLEREGYGGLTGVVLVVEGVPGTFVENGPFVGTWVSMQGGKRLYEGMLTAAGDVAVLRKAKGRKVQ